jgi:sugar phosphate isomerase/epimerase
MKFSICSYSFHRLLAAGKQDVFKYITDCQELGCASLDAWNGHFKGLRSAAEVKKNHTPDNVKLTPEERAYILKIKEAAKAAQLPFGCIAADGGHIFEPDADARRRNRTFAYYSLQVGEMLGTCLMRIDAGGTAKMPDEQFQLICEGYHDLIAKAKTLGIELLIENHFGASPVPENLIRILEANPGLGLLFDTHNWAEGMQAKGWETCAQYAKATHIKTFQFDAHGNEPTVDIPKVLKMLMATGYKGTWGIESCPTDGDEYGGVKKTMALIQKAVKG